MKLFKDRIVHAMDQAGVNQSELARILVVGQSTVNDWRSGKSKGMDMALIFPAARRLGVSPEWLASGNGPQDRSQPLGISQETLSIALPLLDYADEEYGAVRQDLRAELLIWAYSRVLADGNVATIKATVEFEKLARERLEPKGEQDGKRSNGRPPPRGRG